jgi:hypothetical protein
MRNAFLFALVLLSSTRTLHAQTLPADVKSLATSTKDIDFGSASIQPRESETSRVLPEAPIAKTVAPICPAGSGKPCALLGGRAYLRDPFHLSAHDQSWTKAMTNPAMVVSTSIAVASLVVDYKTTRYCIDRRLGKEANPLMGQSRAQELGVGMGLTSLSVFAAGKLKQEGNGSLGIFALWAATLAHGYAAYQNAEKCGY